MADKIKVVAIAIFSESEKKYLFVRRGPDQSGAGFWEFAGGKVEAGESETQALVREIQEELGFSVETEHLQYVSRHTHNYPTKTVDLALYKYTVEKSFVPQLIEHDQFAWLAISDVPQLELSAADIYFLPLLV